MGALNKEARQSCWLLICNLVQQRSFLYLSALLSSDLMFFFLINYFRDYCASLLLGMQEGTLGLNVRSNVSCIRMLLHVGFRPIVHCSSTL